MKIFLIWLRDSRIIAGLCLIISFVNYFFLTFVVGFMMYYYFIGAEYIHTHNLGVGIGMGLGLIICPICSLILVVLTFFFLRKLKRWGRTAFLLLHFVFFVFLIMMLSFEVVISSFFSIIFI